ncbi:ketoacyl-synt-domain-containing protein [Aureobasidium subglaciale]|nr:ketoacyl-synt-domain-containing protein [Aureobasidium subglaciale]
MTNDNNLFGLPDSDYQPIAIVGVEVPKNRFNLDAWYHPDGTRPGSIHTLGGYFLSHDDHLRQFDPSFFGISPLEASSMDPQQRKLLEVVYESFEDAGATLEELSGSKTSCFVGCFTNDMRRMVSRDLEYGLPYEMTGSDMTILSNRINYVFNLKGPSMTVDTACSSSLYALHLACQSLIVGDSEAAVVGGTNIINDIEQHIASVRLGVLSPSSTCHTFDERADGFGRGEGICAVYLKKLSTAVADGDHIRAVIRSTAVNSNGKSQGINHPSWEGQANVIREAYANANLDPRQTGYFECHGTGTQVGDPIEAMAVADVFADGRTPDEPLFLSSVKTNIGHTEGASGLASVIKAVLSIENSLIPATVGVETLNTAIDFRDGRLAVVRKTIPWSAKLPKRVSINSFGYGGANAHCIIESSEILIRPAQGYESTPSVLKESYDTVITRLKADTITNMEQTLKRYLLVFSAHDRLTLEKNIAALATMIHKHPAASVAYILANRRTRLSCTAFATIAGTEVESQSLLDRVQYGVEAPLEALVVAFVFTGQGAQWPTMGSKLIQQYPIVRQTMAVLQSALDAQSIVPDWRLVEELSKPAKQSRMHETALAQPLSTALQIALVVLLRSWGIHPRAVVGHSSGEVAAAFTAGLLTETEAIAIAYYRGIAVSEHGRPGAMMAVGLGADKVMLYLVNQSDVVIACQNSPESVTLSGDVDIISRIHARLNKEGIFSRILDTSGNAYHSHLVKDAGQYYEDFFKSSFAKTSPETPSEVPMYSCINGRVLSCSDQVRIGYWRENLESPVNFTHALSSLIASQPTVNCLIEIGMHSALSGPIKQIRNAIGITPERLCYMPSIIRNGDNVENLISLAGNLWSAGYPINMAAVNGLAGERHRHLPDLPTYQWNYESGHLWNESRLSQGLRFREHARHDLLGSLVVVSSALNPTWRNKLKIRNVPWLSDHRIGDDVIFPAAGYCAMAIEAVTQSAEFAGAVVSGYIIQHLSIKTPLVIPSEGEVEILFDLHLAGGSTSQGSHNTFDFNLSSASADDGWTEHAAGRIVFHEQSTVPSTLDDHVYKADPEDASHGDWYKALAKIGLHYGPSFRPLRQISTNAKDNSATAQINMQTTKGLMTQESHYAIHPTTLDGCIQLAVIAACKGDIRGISKAYLPTTVDNLAIWRTSDSSQLSDWCLLSSHGAQRGMRSVHGSSQLFSSDHVLIAQMTISLMSLEGGFADQESQRAREPFTRLVWQPIIDKDQIDGDLLPTNTSSGLMSVSNDAELLLVYKTFFCPLAKAVEARAKDQGIETRRVALADSEFSITKGSRVLVMAELEGPLLVDMTSQELCAVKALLRMASSLMWVTRGGLLKGKVPEFSIISGMAKSITKAQPSLRLSSIDVDPDDADDVFLATAIVHHEHRLCEDVDCVLDDQLIVASGFVYAGRYVLDSDLNRDAEHQLKPEPMMCQMEDNLELTFRQVGRVESFYFERKPVSSLHIEPDEIQLTPLAYALGPREAAILKGNQVSDYFSNVTESFVAIQAAHIRKGQIILAEGLPDAIAIAIARYAQASECSVILAFDSEEGKISFQDEHPDVVSYASCILSLMLTQQTNILTEGKGIDVALTCPKSTNSPTIWQTLAKDGRLIYTLEGSELPNISLLNPSVFVRGASLSSFDMNDMIAAQSQKATTLVGEVLDLLRHGTIQGISPSATFSLSELPRAVAAVAKPNATSDIVLTFDRGDLVPIHLPYQQVEFSSEFSYVLVGCLGAEKPVVASFISELAKMGAESIVVKGDVSRLEDVHRIVSLAKTPVRGVMQLAMALHSRFFDDMSIENWQGVLSPKIQGTINLHQALYHEPLDFFVMTSSTLGIAGASTQSNYAAANAFLDSMARHRWSLGMEACSIALGMIVGVGHVEDHPEVKQAFEQRNIYGIPEDEFLRMMETACRPRGAISSMSKHDPLSVAQIITGLEPGMLAGSAMQSSWLADPRFCNIATAIAQISEGSAVSQSDETLDTVTRLRAAAASNNENAVQLAVKDLVLQQFSKLTLVSLDKLTTSLERPMADFGMDSMITAELRSWAWRELAADLPFMKLLKGDMRIGALADLVWDFQMEAIAVRCLRRPRGVLHTPTQLGPESTTPQLVKENTMPQQTSTTNQNAADADVASKWGITPNTNTSAKPIDPSTGKPVDWENYYDEETKKELRAKGVNPALKAEMDWHKSQSEGKGFWGKVAQTAMGGGYIK